MLKSFRFVLALLCVGLVCGTGPSARAADSVLPYGANLFQGNFAKSQENGAVAPGDRVVLRLWGGGLNVDGTFTVDALGRIDLPEVGPLPVAGLAHDKLVDDLAQQAGGHRPCRHTGLCGSAGRPARFHFRDRRRGQARPLRGLAQ